jgi:O-antigen/teichoic acid export membrane protein
VTSFILNINQAVKIQLFKYFAESKFDELNGLVVKSTKYQFFIVLMISFPILFETNFILDLWLKNYPPSTIIFTRLGMILCILDTLSNSYMAAVAATGRIKIPSIVLSLLVLLNVPISFLFLKSGLPPYTVVLVAISISLIAFSLRAYFYSNYFNRSFRKTLAVVLWPLLLVAIGSVVFPLIVITHIETSYLRFLVSLIACAGGVLCMGYFIGIDSEDRDALRAVLKRCKVKIQCSLQGI